MFGDVLTKFTGEMGSKVVHEMIINVFLTVGTILANFILLGLLAEVVEFSTEPKGAADFAAGIITGIHNTLVEEGASRTIHLTF